MEAYTMVCAANVKLTAEVERLQRESELHRVNWLNAAHEGDRLREEERMARERAGCNAWERDTALATLARLRELLPRDVLERAEVCARTMRCMTGMAMLAQTYADTAEALHAAAALLWPGEDAK